MLLGTREKLSGQSQLITINILKKGVIMFEFNWRKKKLEPVKIITPNPKAKKKRKPPTKDKTIYRWLSAKSVAELVSGFSISIQIDGQRISLKRRVKIKK